MSYAKEVFKILGVEPNEPFMLENVNMRDKHISEYIYGISESLIVFVLINDKENYWEKSTSLRIENFLRGDVKIRKKPKPTQEEKLAIDYAKACGCNWLAKGVDEIIYAFESKPRKWYGQWLPDENSTYAIRIGIPISFISSDDEKPYNINKEEWL